MGDDKAKLDKKRMKAQLKAEKAKAKAGFDSKSQGPHENIKPWYKDPNWIRAVIAIATLVVAIIALLLTI